MSRNTNKYAELISQLNELSDKEFRAAIRCAKQQRRATRMLEQELIRQKRAKLPVKSSAKDNYEGMSYEPIAA